MSAGLPRPPRLGRLGRVGERCGENDRYSSGISRILLASFSSKLRIGWVTRPNRSPRAAGSRRPGRCRRGNTVCRRALRHRLPSRRRRSRPLLPSHSGSVSVKAVRASSSIVSSSCTTTKRQGCRLRAEGASRAALSTISSFSGSTGRFDRCGLRLQRLRIASTVCIFPTPPFSLPSGWEAATPPSPVSILFGKHVLVCNGSCQDSHSSVPRQDREIYTFLFTLTLLRRSYDQFCY